MDSIFIAFPRVLRENVDGFLVVAHIFPFQMNVFGLIVELVIHSHFVVLLLYFPLFIFIPHHMAFFPSLLDTEVTGRHLRI